MAHYPTPKRAEPSKHPRASTERPKRTTLLSMNTIASIGLALAAGGLVIPLMGTSNSPSRSSGAVDITVGSRPDYSFREAPVNARGVKSLADMRGKPVLVEFWGTR